MYEQRYCPTNCFTITDTGIIEEGIALAHHGHVCAEKKLSPHAQLFVAEISQCNKTISFIVKSPDSALTLPYFVVEVSTGLSSKRSRQFKRGDPSRRVTHGVIGTADVVMTKEWKALLRIYDGQKFVVMYPDGYVRKFLRTGSFLSEQKLTADEMLTIRLEHIETLMKTTEEVQKRNGLQNSLIKLLRLQKKPEHVYRIVDFMKQYDVGTKTATRVQALAPHVATAAELDPDNIPKLRVVKKERKASQRHSNKKIALYVAHRQTFAVHRSSLRA